MKIRRLVQLLLVACLLMAVPAISYAAVFISVTVAPPPIPVYVQPLCPNPGYMWIPGYWGWGDVGYFWVPGAWAPAPAPGLLWTPGYWGWDNGFYIWNAGYWGPQVGFYGGINYGFGYFGVGFVGGEWRGSRFYYNEAVVRVNRNVVRNVYVNKTVIVNRHNESRVSYNGGVGGIHRTADTRELRAQRERRFSATRYQEQQMDWARRNPGSWARNNRGRPSVAATSRAGDFSSKSRVGARSAGGRVLPETLNATPKSMPPARREKGTTSRPGHNQQPRVQQQTAPRERPSHPDTSSTRPEGRSHSQPENRGFSQPETRSKPETRSAPAHQQSEHGQGSKPETRSAPAHQQSEHGQGSEGHRKEQKGTR